MWDELIYKDAANAKKR